MLVGFYKFFLLIILFHHLDYLNQINLNKIFLHLIKRQFLQRNLNNQY